MGYFYIVVDIMLQFLSLVLSTLTTTLFLQVLVNSVDIPKSCTFHRAQKLESAPKMGQPKKFIQEKKFYLHAKITIFGNTDGRGV